VYGTFFFAESTVIGATYLDTMQEWLKQQVDDDSDDLIYQEEGSSQHYHHLVRGYL
jgi:hypothetical protein